MPPTSTLPAALIDPPVSKLPPVTLPLTLNAVNVPTEVILPCAAVVTVPAVVAEVALVALGTVPVTLAPVIELSAAPLPICVPVTLPVTLTVVPV